MAELKPFSFELAKQTNELKKLIAEHPDYPIVVLAGDESNWGVIAGCTVRIFRSLCVKYSNARLRLKLNLSAQTGKTLKNALKNGCGTKCAIK